MNFLQMLNAMRNPQQFLQSAMQNNQITQNPIAMNALNMYKQGDTKGVEKLARSICKERGINVDEALGQIRNQLGM